MKKTNIEMEMMIKTLAPLLPHRDKVGYIAARNTRILREALTEYFIFKERLLKEYGKEIKSEEKAPTLYISSDSENFGEFMKKFNEVKDIEQDINIMTMPYEEVIGILNGNEILELDWMLTD